MRNFGRAAAAIVALSVAGFAPAVAQGTMASTAAAVKAIDTDCSAIQDATMALHPTHLVLVQSHWKVVSDADVAALERTPKSITFVDVWKQGSDYAWVHSHTFDNKGDQRATQTLLPSEGRHAAACPPSDDGQRFEQRGGEAGILCQQRRADSEDDRVRRGRSGRGEDHQGPPLLQPTALKNGAARPPVLPRAATRRLKGAAAPFNPRWRLMQACNFACGCVV